MSNVSALMDARQTYHFTSNGAPVKEIHVHDQATWDILTDPKEFVIKHDPSEDLWTLDDIPLLLRLDPKKAGDFTFVS